MLFLIVFCEVQKIPIKSLNITIFKEKSKILSLYISKTVIIYWKFNLIILIIPDLLFWQIPQKLILYIAEFLQRCL